MENITRASFDRQYEHVGNVRHGVQTGPWRVEFSAAVKDVAASLAIRQGSVVSLNSDGQYVIGCAAGTDANHPVPFISMKNIFDPDVMTGIKGNSMTNTTYSAVGGIITAIPLTCGYEMETTEFDTTATYAPNDGLTAGADTALGKVVKATAAPGGTEPYLGFVSVAPSVDYLNNTRIAFFANFIPAGITAGSVAGEGVDEIEVTGTGSTVTWSYDDGKLTATLS